jgi:ribosome-binding protein aMBF1 (putative translation factor)
MATTQARERLGRAEPARGGEGEAAVPGTPPVGPRVRSLRDAMGLSLRDLAERSGVSAPMLSQVERQETSPTLAVAAKIAAGR